MLIVKKFGGTSVGDKDRIMNVARRCAEDFKKGNDIVLVLSAMGKTTDELIAKAKEINPDPPKRELDMLLTTGEQVSVAMMALAFDTMDIPAVSLNAFQVRMHTTRVHGNARLKRIDTDRIMHELEHRRIVIVTGFQGVNKYDNYTTLGRGGSDTTAVALAAALHADACEIYTDVDGVYTADPRIVPKFYGPFRDAAGSAPAFGDRKSYQMDYHNRREGVKEALLDVEEGADIIMVKPAMSYLDVIAEVKENIVLPVAAYSVSGEYAMIKAGASLGYIDEASIICETAASAYRAGIDLYLTYFAKEIAGFMDEGRIG